MQAAYAQEFLRCPECRRDRTLQVVAHESDERETREGTIKCTGCSSEFPVHRGVADLLPAPPEHVAREAAGLERFADRMRSDGWSADDIRELPNRNDGYWYVQRLSMQQLQATIDFRPGQSLLDVGSNTCWASNIFARAGLRVTALDIATAEMQGLYTADLFIGAGLSYFERVVGSMNDMPIASGSLDYVFCCEVLHHNDPQGLPRTMREAFRVLKPGGKLLVVNETLKTVKDPVGVHTEGVEEFEGYEHAHWALKYRWDATRAGFRTRLMEPSYHWFFGGEPAPGRLLENFRRSLNGAATRKQGAKDGIVNAARISPLGRRAYLAYVNHVKGGVQFNMIATKP